MQVRPNISYKILIQIQFDCVTIMPNHQPSFCNRTYYLCVCKASSCDTPLETSTVYSYEYQYTQCNLSNHECIKAEIVL